MKNQSYDELVDELIAADRAYWVDNKPSMSDYDYDQKLADLKVMEINRTAAGCLNRKDSPTQRLGGYALEGFSKVEHKWLMLSLENSYTHEDMEKRLKVMGKQVFCVESKVDGLAVSLKYVDGLLVQASTRGNGSVGDDITANARTIKSIPLQLSGVPKNSEIHIRGECYMSFSTFKKLNAKKKEAGEQLLANPRNAAAGALKLLDSKECAKRQLSFVPYQILCEDTAWLGRELGDSQAKTHAWFESKGFEKLCPVEFRGNVEETMDAVIRFEAVRKGLPYPTDGCVVKINDLAARKEFSSGTKSVRWAFAFKYAPDQVETKLKSVTFQVGLTGIICPVAELSPVELDGSVISRATLCNEDRMKDLDLREGDTVSLRKAGYVIPEIISTIKEARTGDGEPIKFPEYCPACGTWLKKVKIADGEGANWKCNNEDGCTPQICGRIERWCSKAAMNIESVGPETIRLLFNAGVAETIPQLYGMDIAQLVAVRGIRETSANSILNQVEQSKDAGMERVLIGLGIPRTGETLSRKIARVFPDIRAFFKASGKELEPAGLGYADFMALSEWWGKPKNKELVTLLEMNGIDMKSKTYSANATAGHLAGKVFVFTGTIALERDVASRMVEAAGGKVTGSVSKKTSFVVVGAEPGSKKTKAETLGIPILDEDEFLKLVEVK